MKKLLCSVGLVFVMSGVVDAKTPPEVLEPYKKYRAALKARDVNEALKQSLNAWQRAEKLLGDHKITGDLAANYSDIVRKNPSSQEVRKWMKAYERAIELAPLHEENAVDIELERHIKRLETGTSVLVRKRKLSVPVGDYENFEIMMTALQKHGRIGSVFEGDMEVLRLKYHRLLDEWDKGVIAGKRANVIYSKEPKSTPSPYRDTFPIYMGDLFSDMDEPLKAALEYQKLFHPVAKASIPQDLVKKARFSWIKSWFKLDKEGTLNNATAHGLCDCTPKEGADGLPAAIMRIPPIFAPKAERSGHVYLKFDLSDAGSPKNIKVLASTEKLFEESAKNGVSKWRYSSASAKSNLQFRKSIYTRIDYKLNNNNGELVPPKPLKKYIDYPENAENLKAASAVVVTGSRIVRR